jgi:spoIIIJ-associated protein
VVPTDGPSAVTVSFEGEVSAEGRSAAAALEDLLTRMGLGLELRVMEQDDQILIDLRTEVYAEILEARELELAQALELVVEKGLEGDRKLVLDVNGAKGRAEAELASTARAFAEKAVEQQRVMKLGPLDPRARRIVHMTLKSYPGVVTKSEGEGLFRRVGIIPAALAASEDDTSEG